MLPRDRTVKSKGRDMNNNDLWEVLGSLEDEQAYQVLTQLFARYEQRREQYPDDPTAKTFFQDLAVIMLQVQSCNVNRR
jgi:hypothetical protein